MLPIIWMHWVFLLISIFTHVESFCMGMFCSYMPLMAKSCCSITKKCCLQYQSWLSPLIGHEDIVDEYLDAITHEVYHDNTPLGTGPLLPPGGFPGMINRFPTSYMHNMHGSAYAGFHRRVDPFAAASSKLNTIASPNQSSSPNLIPSNQAQTSGNEINVISSNGFNSNNHNNNLPGANGFSSGLVASSSNGNPNHINNHNLAPSGISLAIQPSMLNQAYKSLRRLDLKGNERT